jgi:hypothetical protein
VTTQTEITQRSHRRQAAEHVRADAAKRRASYFSGLQAAVDQMRDRGQRLAAIATPVAHRRLWRAMSAE